MTRIILAEYKRIEDPEGKSYNSFYTNLVKESYLWHKALKRNANLYIREDKTFMGFNEFCISNGFNNRMVLPPKYEYFKKFTPYSKRTLSFFKAIRWININKTVLNTILDNVPQSTYISEEGKRKFFFEIKSTETILNIIRDIEYAQKRKSGYSYMGIIYQSYGYNSEDMKYSKRVIKMLKDFLKNNDFDKKCYCFIIEFEL